MQRTLAAALCVSFLAACSGSRPDNLGVNNNQLQPCPDRPNCVSSQAMDAEHQIDAISFSGDMAATHQKLTAVINGMERANIITSKPDYIYAEFSTEIMGYVDDVEFWFAPDGKTIQVRSASRIGYSDWGVNRKRVEAVRSNLGS